MRLIDAEPIEKFIEDGLNNPDKLKAFGHDAIEVLTEIHFAPTIDPASLRPKGECIYNTDDFTPKKRCTNCGYNKPLVAGEAIKQEPDNYCPNCGADMRGETHDS